MCVHACAYVCVLNKYTHARSIHKYAAVASALTNMPRERKKIYI